MTGTLRSAQRLMLAGLDRRDAASAAHPYLHLAGLEALAARSAMRRARTARLTPGGLPQPPEVMGVDADARVPNLLQPMSGEFEDGHEVGGGRPAFFGPSMPSPTGLADGVGVDRSRGANPLFGAPTGMVVRAPQVGADRFAWQPPAAANYAALAALPHFASGGVVPPGQTGVVGERGQELVKALPGGGAQVTPVPPATRGVPAGAAALQPFPPAPAVAPGGLAAAFGGGHSPAPSGDPIAAPPQQQDSAEQSYEAMAHTIAAARPPDPNDPALRTPAWKQALGVALGALAAGAARRPDPGLGAAMYEATAPDLYTEAAQRYALNQRSQLAALAPLQNAARLEQAENAANTRAWQTQVGDTLRQQQVDANSGYRALQLHNSEQAERERERQDQALDAARASTQQALSDYRRQVLNLRRQLQAAKGAPRNADTTQQALRALLGAGSRAQAEQYLAANRANLAAHGANLDLLQRALTQRWARTTPGPRHP